VSTAIAHIGRRYLPRGWSDLFRQLLIWFGFIFAYQIARGVAARNPAKAFSDGFGVIKFEKHAHALFELSLQHVVASSHLLATLTYWTYGLSQFAVLGVALPIRATLPHMLERDAGHYVITSSVAGRRVVPGSLYSASKWAVTAMGEALRAELRQMRENTSIRVTLIEPGMVDTPFFDNRPGEGALMADDVARAVMYALSQPQRVDVNEILIRPTNQAN